MKTSARISMGRPHPDPLPEDEGTVYAGVRRFGMVLGAARRSRDHDTVNRPGEQLDFNFDSTSPASAEAPRPGRMAQREGENAFTMIEVALALAIIAFALVALIGVLPSGMTVQRDNRWSAIINEDGQFWINAIRSGARDSTRDLTANVQEIRIVDAGGLMPPLPIIPTTTSNIIGLLSQPYTINRAQVRAISGPSGDQARGSSLEYMMYVMITNYPAINLTNAANPPPDLNLWDVRLVFRWPVYPDGSEPKVGKKSRRVFRTIVRGQLEPLQTNSPIHFFRDQLIPL